MGQRRRRGSVAIENSAGMLRLRWRHGGRRYTLSLGMAFDSEINQAVAQQRATQIQLDCVSGNFDPTLEKYRGRAGGTDDRRDRVLELWERYLAHKARVVTSARTLEKYRALSRHLVAAGISNRPAATVNQAIALHLVDYLLARLSPRTAREHLTNLAACWRWGELDPSAWEVARSPVKANPKQKDRPFDRAELLAILAGFESRFPHYLPFVHFLIGTGCRIGEAKGLLWKHLDQDCRTAWIGEVLDRFNNRRSTKNRVARTVLLPDSLRQILLKLPRGDGDSLVFPGVRGAPIDDHNFSQRIWVAVLRDQGIPYRSLRKLRHTVVSHAIESGASVADLAAQTGHSPQVLLRDYLSAFGVPVLPDLGRRSSSALPKDDPRGGGD